VTALADKVLVVTGGASGIGLGVVEHFLDAGVAGAVVADSNADKAEIEARRLGDRCTSVETDVSDWRSVDHLVDRSLAESSVASTFSSTARASPTTG
jgi:NAD(P)-dependent dehydrogenase (short-subunit alcohol dehydrogenase family)